VPPPARSQPRFEEKPAPARAFQPSLSDDEVTTFMASPAKKSTRNLLSETGETRTSAKKHIRPPAPSIVDEDEDEGRTQIRPMPKGGKLSLPTSSVSVAKVRESAPREPVRVADSEPPPARKELRVPEISLPKAAAVVSEMPDLGSQADAPDFTVQLGAGPAAKPAPAAAKSVPPPQMSTHQFAPVTSAPLRSQPPPAMASTAMMGAPPSSGMMPPQPMSGPGMMGPQMGPMSMGNPSMGNPGMGNPSMNGMPMNGPMMGPPAMMSGPVPAMSQAQMAGMSGGFPQQGAAMSGGYAAQPGRIDPPGTAVSLSAAKPKPVRGWVVAFVAVTAVAAIAAFVVSKGTPNGQATAAAFVDPSQAPGEAPPPANPGAPAAPAPSAAPAQPTPAELLAQPAQPTVAQPAVAVAPPPAPAVKESSKPPVAAAPAPAPAPPKPIAKVSPPPAPPVAADPPKPKPVKEPVAKGTPKEDGPKKTPSAADKEMKDAADALARAQLEQSL